MTVNEIKIAALQIMFTNYAHDIRDENVDEIVDEEYTQYIVNMDACINRALGRFESANVLPLCCKEYTHYDGDVGDYNTRYDLSVISDFRAICRVIYERGRTYVPSCEYALEGDVLVLPTLPRDGKYRLLYHKRLKRIAIACPSSTVLDVSDDLAELIPYYIKAELLEEDEPSLATQARNIFEAMLAEREKPYASGQNSVKNIFGDAQ